MLHNHHEKYLEIDGVDKVVVLSTHDHAVENSKIRYQKTRPPIPRKIVDAAKNRLYNHPSRCVDFVQTIAPYVELFEQIRYSPLTGAFHYQSHFRGYHKVKLPIVEAKT